MTCSLVLSTAIEALLVRGHWGFITAQGDLSAKMSAAF